MIIGICKLNMTVLKCIINNRAASAHVNNALYLHGYFFFIENKISFAHQAK